MKASAAASAMRALERGVGEGWTGAVLAQARTGAREQALMWVGVLILVVVIAGVVMMLVRRRMMGGESTSEKAESLMTSVRRMRDEGRLSAEEYDAIRKRLVNQAAAGMGLGGGEGVGGAGAAGKGTAVVRKEAEKERGPGGGVGGGA